MIGDDVLDVYETWGRGEVSIDMMGCVPVPQKKQQQRRIFDEGEMTTVAYL